MKYIIANWKMNMEFAEVNQWLNSVEKLITNTNNTIIIAPSFIHIPFVSIFARKYTNLKVAAQDISLFEKGAHTGSIGLNQIKEFCDFCIVGHSELKEDAQITLEKTTQCIANGIIPIVCSIDPKNKFKTIEETALIAWEDPTNISKNGVYNEKPFMEVETEVETISRTFPKNSLIYGGSVNEENSKDIAKIDKLSGVLVGNASLNPQTFWKIVTNLK
jgi:triosephosphate isomerase (TIM)